MAAFPEVNQASWGKNEDELIKWMATAIAWVAVIRRYCRAWMLSVEGARELNIGMCGDHQLTFEELIEGVVSLRDRIEKASERLEILKAKNRAIDAQVQELHYKYTTGFVGHEPGSPLEEGEIEQDAGMLRAAQWEQVGYYVFP